MARAVVLPSLARAAAQRVSGPSARRDDDESPVIGGSEGTTHGAAAQAKGDEYLERLAKYVPAEILAPFLVVSSATSISDVLLVALLATFGAGAVIWALTRNLKLDAALRQPSSLIVIFSALAYAGWALGTSGTVQSLVGISQAAATPILAAIAFVLPLVDDYLGARRAASLVDLR